VTRASTARLQSRSFLSADAELKTRFEREAKAIAALAHPHICTLYDVGHQAGTDYLVLEYLEGETLAARLQRGPLTLDETTSGIRENKPRMWQLFQRPGGLGGAVSA
jgi:serine/threonine protein kinase